MASSARETSIRAPFDGTPVVLTDHRGTTCSFRPSEKLVAYNNDGQKRKPTRFEKNGGVMHYPVLTRGVLFHLKTCVADGSLVDHIPMRINGVKHKIAIPMCDTKDNFTSLVKFTNVVHTGGSVTADLKFAGRLPKDSAVSFGLCVEYNTEPRTRITVSTLKHLVIDGPWFNGTAKFRKVQTAKKAAKKAAGSVLSGDAVDPVRLPKCSPKCPHQRKKRKHDSGTLSDGSATPPNDWSRRQRDQAEEIFRLAQNLFGNVDREEVTTFLQECIDGTVRPFHTTEAHAKLGL